MAIEQENIWMDFGKRGYSDVNQMKIVPDKQAVVRLLPKKKNAKETIFQYSSHWVEQTTGVRFPIFHDVSKSCPICKFVQQLWADVNELKDNGLTDDSEEVKKKKDFIYSINAKASYDINVLDRKNYEDEEGNIIVKRWTVGNAIFLPLQELGKDPEWGSPTHDEEGYDIRVMGTKQGMGTKYNVSGSKTTSPLTDEEIEALNKRGYDLATLRSAEFTTDEKINEILKNAKIKQLRFLSDEKKQEEDDEEGVVRLSRPRAKTKSLLDDDEDEQTVTKKRPLLDDDEDDVPVSTKKKKPVDDEDEPVSTKKKKQVDEEEPVSSKKKKPAVDEEEPVSTKKKKQVDEEEDEEPASTTSKKKKPVDDEEDEEPVSTKKKKPTVVDDEEDEPAPTTSKKKKQTVDEEDEEPVSSKKKKPVVDDEEDEPAPTTSKKKKPVDEEETSSKKKKKIDEDEDDDDEEITPAPRKKQVETKKQDEEDEPSSKVITEFDSFECEGMHDPKDSACNECEFIDECVELQELAEQAEGLGLEVREKDMVKSKSEILKMMKTVKTKKIDF